MSEFYCESADQRNYEGEPPCAGVVKLREQVADLQSRLGAALNLLGRWDAAVDAVTNGHAEFDAFDVLSAEGLKMRLEGQSAGIVET